VRYSIPRKSRRVPLSTLVNLKLERLSGAVTEITSDLSLGGMFVPSDTPAEIGSLVAFEFKVGEDQVEGTGEVIWQRKEGEGPDQPPGMGIRFRYLSPGSRERIFRLVQRYTQEGEEALSSQSGDVPKTQPSEEPLAPVLPLVTEEAAAKVIEPYSLEPSASASTLSAATDASQRLAEPSPPLSSTSSPSPTRPRADDPIAAAVEGLRLPEILQPPREEEEVLLVETEPEEPSKVEEPIEEESKVEEERQLEEERSVEETSEPVQFADLEARETGAGLLAQSVAEAVPPAAATESAFEAEAEPPGWLRPDPPDLPDMPVPPELELVLPGDMTPIYDGDDTAAPARPPQGQWPVQGSGYAEGRGHGGLKLGGRKFVLGLLLLGIAAIAIYLLVPPLMARFSANDGDSERVEVAAPASIASDSSGGSSPAGQVEPEPAGADAATGASFVEPSSAAPKKTARQDTASNTTAPIATAPLTTASPAEEPSNEGGGEDSDRLDTVARPQPAPPEPATSVVTQPMSQIQDIRWRGVAGGTLLTIEADGAISADRFKRQRLAQAPPRELIRFLRVNDAFASRQLTVGSTELRSVRTGFHAGRELHVVLDLADPAVEVVSADAVGAELRILLRRP